MDPSKTTSSQHEQQHDSRSVSVGDSFCHYNEGNPPSKAADSLRAALHAHSANPGPAIPKDFNVQQEGTKEERQAKAKEMNK
ncbi:hypothetical protein VTJ49DRAFT_6867 [Mycothermus thermophilus]|uniref:Uncharacterized protein n=1 Tax=Humicola insolens TaxID=85995 RepID=A0ABR3VPV4_HUMIN